MDTEELKARLNALKDETEEFESEFAQDIEAELLQEKVAEAELNLANTKAIAAAIKEHGPRGKRITVVPTAMGVVIMKKVPAPLYRQLMDQENITTEDIERLVHKARVYPAAAQLETIFTELPGTITACGAALSTLMGVSFKQLAGK